MAAQTNAVPRGTGHKSEPEILQVLNACNLPNFGTLKDVALSGLKGEPLDDKTYLMERIIDLVADLPPNHKYSDTLTKKFLHELWDDLSHPPNSYLGFDYAFRKADGSNNNIMWPHIGKAGQPYARSVRPVRMQPPRPDPGIVYDAVLKRKEFCPHPNGISSVLFYVASIIIHDCFHTSHKDYAISETSSYLDLAPLYGSNDDQQREMRTGKNGKIHPDCFSDNRVLGFPPGVGVLLIMFNRFHNDVVENLAKIDEGGRFSSILDERRPRRTGLTPREEEEAKPKRTASELYDEALFQTGRLVTTGLYINIVLQDYVRTILGLNKVDTLWNLDPRAPYNKGFLGEKIPEAGGNQVSAEFSLVYRWHSCVSKRDEKWTDGLIAAVEKEYPAESFIKAAADWADKQLKQHPTKRPFEGLKRQADGRFSDDDLCKIWMESVDDVAGAFGAAHVPENLKFVEVLSMIQARSWNLASLNEFRAYFRLKPHETFESINPDPYIADQLKKLYGHPDNVEIYPGIVVESAKKVMDPGSGLCASWTTSRAILADAVALVRGDRFYTVDYTPNNLTNWGFARASYDTDINHGGVFYKLVLNAFPNHISKNSVYAHFPLVNPPANQEILKGMDRQHLYDFDPPRRREVVKADTTALKNSETLFAQRASGWGGSRGTPNTKMSFAEAIMADDGWETATTKFYNTTLTNLWKERQYELGGYQQVDVVDVANMAHTKFIKEVLGVPLDKDHEHYGLLGHIYDSAYTVDAKPTGLNGWIRGLAHRVVDAVGSLYGSEEKESRLAQNALVKMGVTGADAKKATWQDVLPTAALINTLLSRSSASAVESSIADEEAQPSTIALRAEGQVVVVDLQDSKMPEVVLALQVAVIANKALLDIVEKTKGIQRVPGPHGRIKKVIIGGEVRYLNEVESDYVASPVSMKVRWKH